MMKEALLPLQSNTNYININSADLHFINNANPQKSKIINMNSFKNDNTKIFYLS